MNNKKLMALAAAMLVGAAGAVGTTAGEQINNTATASFTNPNYNPDEAVSETNKKTISTESNTVTTIVNPLPDFTITPNDGDPLGVPNPKLPGQEKDGFTPGATVDFNYTVTNTGNTPLVVQLDPNVNGDNVSYSNTERKISDIKYTYVNAAGKTVELKDTNGDGLVELPQLAPDEDIEITQTYVLPEEAESTDVYGANPVGTAYYDTNVSDGKADVDIESPDAQLVQEDGATKTDNDNFNQVTLTTPDVSVGSPTDPKNPDGDTETPPQDGTVVVPPSNPGSSPEEPDKDNGTVNNPVTPDSPEDGSTDAPTKPGYDSPEGTNIVIVDANKQEAYPPADDDDIDDEVTFNNTVTNNGTQPDTVTIFPPTVSDPDATAEIIGLTDEDDSTPGIQVTLQPGETKNYQVKVTYPDDDNADSRDPITVTIGVDSGNDGDDVVDVETVDIVYPPAMQFGDSTPAQGAVSTPEPVQTIDPTAPASGDPTDTTTATDSTASFPMDVANTGAYNDTYKLSGSMPDFPDATVVYYDANGNELPTDADGNYITPVVAPGQEFKGYAVVNGVPADTATGDYLLNQTAVSNYSGITLVDNNDIVRVSPNGDLKVAKFQKGADAAAPNDTANGITAPDGYGAGLNYAAPNEQVDYAIIAKNNYNTAVEDFKLCDGLPENTQFVNVAGNGTGPFIYSVNNGIWGDAPTTLADNATVCVALDDGNGAPAALASGEEFRVDFAVTVK